MFDGNSVTGESLVFFFLLGGQLLLLLFLVRYKQFFAFIVIGHSLETQLDPDTMIFKPALRRRKLFLQHPVIMRLTDPAQTEIQNDLCRTADRDRFYRMRFFFPES